MRVLVTGGAGYIGSVVVEELLAAGAEQVVVLDDLSQGRLDAVVPPAVLVRGDIADRSLVESLCRRHAIDTTVHLAAASLVGESMTDPGKYYDVNLTRGLLLLDALLAAGVRRLVFSSSAAVYGEPDAWPITESFPTAPTNPYGESKLAFERALRWYGRAHGLRYVSLRYFNAAGATAANGEQHRPETHLIPLVLEVARGAREAVEIFGADYPTPDGTCVRDYVHVSDLARAHVLAIGKLREAEEGTEGVAGGRAAGGQQTRGRAAIGQVYNLGSGGGYSVRQVIETAERVTGRPIPTRIGPRRAGDPAVLLASSERIRSELGWQPRKPELWTILEDAWAWLLAHPAG